MDGRRRTGRFRFWLPALLWLPGGMLAVEVLRMGSVEHVMRYSSLVSLSAARSVRVPLALACRRLTRSQGLSGSRPGGCGVALGAAAVANLLVPLPVGVRAILVSLPVWLAVWRLTPRPRGPGFAPSSRRPGRGRSRGPFR